MKNKNNLLLILPLIVFVGTFLIIRAFDSRSFAIDSDNATYKNLPSGTLFDIVKKNTYGWYTISSSGGSSTGSVGTWYMRSSSKISGEYYKAVAYQATYGENFIQSRARKRYNLGSSGDSRLSSSQQKHYKKVMPFMYPYIYLGATFNDGGSLKEALKDSSIGLSGSLYNDYEFDKLNASEAVTAAQAAIWSIQTGRSFKYKSTLSSFSDFDTCEKYHSGKILTTQEKEWYEASGCSENGNFYKYVFQHYSTSKSKATSEFPYDANVENRINTLINWYVNDLKNKTIPNTVNKDPMFIIKPDSTTFTGNTLHVEFEVENIDAYQIVFKDENGNVLKEQDINNADHKYTIENIPDSVKMINIAIKSTDKKTHVIYYYSCKGTDLIGVENTLYEDKLNLKINRQEEPRGRILIYKVGNSPTKGVEVTKSTTGNFNKNKCEGACLSGARLELYYQNTNNMIREILTNYGNDGLTPLIIPDLPMGTYYLKETQAVKGYDLYEFDKDPVDSDGFIRIDIKASDANSDHIVAMDVVINNTLANNICFTKVDSANPSMKLIGSTFVIQDIDGNVIQDRDFDNEKNLGIFTMTADEQTVCFDGNHHKRLESGSYFLKEITAPTGYSVSPTRYLFSVGGGLNEVAMEDVGAYVRLKPVNDVISIPNTKGLTLTKTNALDGSCVNGARLVLKDSTGAEVVNWDSTCTKDGDQIGYNIPICLSDAEKQIYAGSTCLLPGTYTLSETVVPTGYAKAEDKEIVIGTDGKITGDPNVKNEPIEVCIYKVKKGTTEEILAGAELEIYNSTGAKITTFTSSDEPCLSSVLFAPGKYTIKEIKAPEGYQLPKNNETVIEVKNKAGKQNFYVENEVIAPKTSIDYSMTVIIIASIFMMFGIGLVGYYEYKKQH